MAPPKDSRKPSSAWLNLMLFGVVLVCGAFVAYLIATRPGQFGRATNHPSDEVLIGICIAVVVGLICFIAGGLMRPKRRLRAVPPPGRKPPGQLPRRPGR